MKALIISLPKNIEFLIKKDPVIFGRSKKNDIVITGSFVSRKHCTIFSKDNKYFLEDLKSQNGTYINGKLIKEIFELKDNDIISLGKNGPMYQFRIEEGSPDDKINFLNKGTKKFFRIKTIKYIIPVLFIFLILIGFYNFKTLDLVKKIDISNLQSNDKYSEIKIRFAFYKIMKRYEENYYHLDQILFKRIVEYINFYRADVTFNDAKKRRERYKDMIEKIFTKNKIPFDLSYIAFVESDFQVKAYNPYSGARGLWQLMPATARQYGLQVNRKVDERIDPKKSTEAAASYINDLIAIFGLDSILLVLAAYNVGEGVISNSLRMIDDPKKDRSFWYLYKNNLIPDETKEYVLKIIALMILCEDTD